MMLLESTDIEFFNQANCYDELELMIVIHLPKYPFRKIIVSKKDLINNLKRLTPLKLYLANINTDNIGKTEIRFLLWRAEIYCVGNTITKYKPRAALKRKLDAWEKEYYKTHNKLIPLEWYRNKDKV